MGIGSHSGFGYGSKELQDSALGYSLVSEGRSEIGYSDKIFDGNEDDKHD